MPRLRLHPSLKHPSLLLLVAALLVVSPLLLHGASCGQDQGFHLQSWLDAATQLSHGHYPHWANSPAWNAGEPRFIFYPPLSWLLGALLTQLLPIQLAPIAFTFLALAASGLTMQRLAGEFTSAPASLLAAALYLANPYILFCAFERTAFAELLAAAWIPLLLLAILRPRPTVRGLAIPVALLWLTNAPAAVIGCYALALLATLRAAIMFYKKRQLDPNAQPVLESPASPNPLSTLQLIATCTLGTALGLALPAYYLLPAATERRYVQVAMAIIPNMRYQDNFLFTRTADAAHNAVNHTASVLAVALLLLSCAALAALWLLQRRTRQADAAFAEAATLLAPLTLLLLAVLLMLTPASAWLWAHLPELAFVQFPWRMLMLVAPVLALAVALLYDRWAQPQPTTRWLTAAALLLPLALGGLGYRLYAQSCDLASLPTTIAHLYRTGHGAPPTDEYTPTDADNDVLRSDNPGYWLADHLNDPAPHTTPTPAELHPGLDGDDAPIPDSQTLSQPAPRRLHVDPSQPGYLILNLRDYPNWRVTLTAPYIDGDPHIPHLQRDDGLLALPLLAGPATVAIDWQTSSDEVLGIGLSLAALALYGWVALRRHRPSRIINL